MRPYILAVLATLTLTTAATAQTGGPTPEQAKVLAKREMTDALRDPDSAAFRDVRYSRQADGRIVFCGEINARNGLGGYMGYVRFITSVTQEREVAAEIAFERNTSSRMIVQAAWPRFCGDGTRPITF